MALEHPRLLALSLIAAFAGASCSTPAEPVDAESVGREQQQPVKSESVAAGAAPVAAKQDAALTNAPGQKPEKAPEVKKPSKPKMPQSVADQRREALVAYYLESARKLRATGKVQGAHIELSKASKIDPDNQAVATELAAVRAKLGIGAPRSKVMSRIAIERTLALVQFRLTSAEQLIVARDYDGALEELQRAELLIKVKKTLDWGDLPTKVKAARAKAEDLKKAQAPGKRP